MRSTLPFVDLERYAAACGQSIRAVGASGSMLKEMRAAGEVPWLIADRIACRQFGVHPAAIWPGWVDDGGVGSVAEQLRLAGIG
jgi:lambda repressor-like predicted transcriptional regulator